MFTLRKPLRPLLLLLLSILIIAKIVALSPASLEEEVRFGNRGVDPESLVEDVGTTLVPGVPQERIAEYAVEKFSYLSIQKSIKQWKIDARVAFLYNPERLVHARNVKAYLYDADDQVTVISGLEARYFLNKRDLEIYGNVKTIFPDGFELDSEYLRYLPNERRILIPTTYKVHGINVEHEKPRPSKTKGTGKAVASTGKSEGSAKPFAFTSMGLDYDMAQQIIKLPEHSQVIYETPTSSDYTIIDSDHCLIHRETHLAQFTMNPARPLSTRFTHITQPNLVAKSRRTDLYYGDYDEVLHFLILYEDVVFREMSESQLLRYGTSNHAEFDAQQNIMVLTEYPQVYENENTVTGDKILLYRKTNVVIVDKSNSFTESQ